MFARVLERQGWDVLFLFPLSVVVQKDCMAQIGVGRYYLLPLKWFLYALWTLSHISLVHQVNGGLSFPELYSLEHRAETFLGAAVGNPYIVFISTSGM